MVAVMKYFTGVVKEATEPTARVALPCCHTVSADRQRHRLGPPRNGC